MHVHIDLHLFWSYRSSKELVTPFVYICGNVHSNLRLKSEGPAACKPSSKDLDHLQWEPKGFWHQQVEIHIEVLKFLGSSSLLKKERPISGNSSLPLGTSCNSGERVWFRFSFCIRVYDSLESLELRKGKWTCCPPGKWYLFILIFQ